MLLTNAHLITPGREQKGASILIENNKIVEIAEETSGDFDLGGKMLLPGFIDIHAHGADGADSCDASAESLEHIARTKLKEGVTTWLPTTLTQPSERLLEIVRVIADWAPSAPLHIPGVHLEGPYINREKAGAQNPEFVRPPDVNELRDLHRTFPALVISLAPEIPGVFELIREAASLGIAPSAAHTAADYACICTAMGFGLKHLTHFGNAMTGLHHREIGVVGAGFLEEGLQIEVIADGVHLSPDMLQLIFRKVARENIMLITDSTSASWQPDGETSLGGLPVVIRHGEARLKSNQALAGSTLRFPEGLKLIHDLTREPLCDLIATTSWNQARSLGLADRGKIEPGFRADLVVMDHQFQVERTFVDGREKFSPDGISPCR
jgi:N-acetylglucosamine-6-phosphate deacetylase